MLIHRTLVQFFRLTGNSVFQFLLQRHQFGGLIGQFSNSSHLGRRVHADALFCRNAFRQHLGICRTGRDNHLAQHIQRSQRLNMDDLGIFLHVDVLTRLDFRLSVDAVAGKHRDILCLRIAQQRLRRRTQIEQAALLSLDRPLRAVTVAIEQNALVRSQFAANQLGERRLKVIGLFQLVRKRHQLVRNSGVEHDIRAGDVEGRSGHTEFKLVARERERRSAVAVGIILRDMRQARHADIHALVPRRLVIRAIHQRMDDCGQLVADIHGDDGGRRLIRAQAMIVARAGDAQAKQILILVHRFNDSRQEQQELCVLHRRRAGIQQVFALVGGNRPVVVFARTIHAVKRLFMQQADQPVAIGDLLHDFHGQLVVIRRDVCRRKNRRHLMLAGRNLVVLGLGIDAQLPEFLVQIGHKRLDARTDRTEIVILHFLSLRAHRAEERASGQNQIGALLVILFIDQEIFLLRADGRRHAGNRLAEELQHAAGFLADGLHRAQQRRFLIQNLARVGTERRRDAQRIILDKGVAGRVPRGIAARLKCCAQTAGREGRRIRLALDQLFAREFHDHRAIRAGRDERIMLLGGDAGHWLEPMGEMSGTLLNRPILHGVGHNARHLRVERRSLPHRLLQRFIDILGQSFLHDGLVKDHAAKQFGNFLHSNLSHLRRVPGVALAIGFCFYRLQLTCVSITLFSFAVNDFDMHYIISCNSSELYNQF